MGAIASGGLAWFDPEMLDVFKVKEEALCSKIEEERIELSRREKLYREDISVKELKIRR